MARQVGTCTILALSWFLELFSWIMRLMESIDGLASAHTGCSGLYNIVCMADLKQVQKTFTKVYFEELFSQHNVIVRDGINNFVLNFIFDGSILAMTDLCMVCKLAYPIYKLTYCLITSLCPQVHRHRCMEKPHHIGYCQDNSGVYWDPSCHQHQQVPNGPQLHTHLFWGWQVNKQGTQIPWFFRVVSKIWAAAWKTCTCGSGQMHSSHLSGGAHSQGSELQQEQVRKRMVKGLRWMQRLIDTNIYRADWCYCPSYWVLRLWKVPTCLSGHSLRKIQIQGSWF